MGWIESKSVGLFLPAFTDEFVNGETAQSPGSLGEVVSGDKVSEMGPQLVVAIVVVALDGGFFDGTVHAFHLPVGPGMIRFRQPMFDAVQKQTLLNGYPRKRAVGPLRFFGRSANWIPLSVSTVRMRYGTT